MDNVLKKAEFIIKRHPDWGILGPKIFDSRMKNKIISGIYLYQKLALLEKRIRHSYSWMRFKKPRIPYIPCIENKHVRNGCAGKYEAFPNPGSLSLY
ncbi:MAG: hypothetical protein ACTSU4_14440 [Promethearchaeota archaeon]